jgi:hypothetical protein
MPFLFSRWRIVHQDHKDPNLEEEVPSKLGEKQQLRGLALVFQIEEESM